MFDQLLEAGCDEAGRGCLAGPVTAAAVILPKHTEIKGLDDSKKLTHDKRFELREEIFRIALSYGIVHIPPAQIDAINILQASILAMHQALDQLAIRPNHILVDGNYFRPYGNIKHTCVIKGDSKYASIAAASILAKTERDKLMTRLSEGHPEYSWFSNFGYPTKAHKEAIKSNGITAYHRLSFKINHTH